MAGARVRSVGCPARRAPGRISLALRSHASSACPAPDCSTARRWTCLEKADPCAVLSPMTDSP